MSPYKTYVIKSDNNPDKLNKITSWMSTHNIQFGYATTGKPLKGFEYRSQSVNNFTLSTEDIVVNIYQPKVGLSARFSNHSPNWSTQ